MGCLSLLVLILTASPLPAQRAFDLSPLVDPDQDGRLTFSEIRQASDNLYAGLISYMQFVEALTIFQRFQVTGNQAVTTGSQQVVDPEQILPEPFVITLEDEFGAPMVGVPVTAEIVAGEGDLSVEGVGPPQSARSALSSRVRRVTSVTDENGRAQFRLTVGASDEDVMVVVTGAQTVATFVTTVGEPDVVQEAVPTPAPTPTPEPTPPPECPEVLPTPFLVVDTLEDQADPPFDSDEGLAPVCRTDLPGADGRISLREALIAANNAEEIRGIRFSPRLAGGTIILSFDDADADIDADELPPVRRPNFTIDGDADVDGTGDIAIDGRNSTDALTNDDGIRIRADGVDISGLTLKNFRGAAIVITTLKAPALRNIQILENTIELPSGLTRLTMGVIVAGIAEGVTIADNIVLGSGAPNERAILVTSADASLATGRRGEVRNVTIRDNRLHAPIVLLGSQGGPGGAITNTSITGNAVSADAAIAIRATFPEPGTGVSITNTNIAGNTLRGLGSSARPDGLAAGTGIWLDACCGQRITLLADVVNNSISNFRNEGVVINVGEDGNTLSAGMALNRVTGNAGNGVRITGRLAPTTSVTVDLGGGAFSVGGNTLRGNGRADLSVQVPISVTAIGNLWDHTSSSQILSLDVQRVSGATVRLSQ